MASSQFTYNRHLHRYRFKSSGKVVSPAAVESLTQKAIASWLAVVVFVN
jgi:hypothetical protein